MNAGLSAALASSTLVAQTLSEQHDISTITGST
jgi:hypothetical protein